MMIWINIKRFNHLQATFSFDTVLLHASSVMFMVASQIDKHISALNPPVQKFLLYQNHWFRYLSIVIKIWLQHIIFISLKQIKYFLQLFHFYGWWTVISKGKANLMQQKRLYCCFSRSHPTQEIFLSFPLFFVYFYFRFFGLLRRLNEVWRVWFIFLPQKVWAKSSYVTNIEIISFGHSLTWSSTS